MPEVDREWEATQFRRFSGLLSTDRIAAWKQREAPDFLIRLASGLSIGLEVTKSMRADRSLVEDEGRQFNILAAAYRRRSQRGLPPVRVLAEWSSAPPVERVAQDAIAMQIERFVATYWKQDGMFFDAADYSSELPTAIASLFVQPSFEHRGRDWWSGGGSDYVTQPFDLQSVFDRKERRVPRYKALGVPLWLLIVEDPALIASWIGMGASIQAYCYRSTFVRAFLLTGNPDALTELSVSPP